MWRMRERSEVVDAICAPEEENQGVATLGDSAVGMCESLLRKAPAKPKARCGWLADPRPTKHHNTNFESVPHQLRVGGSDQFLDVGV